MKRRLFSKRMLLGALGLSGAGGNIFASDAKTEASKKSESEVGGNENLFPTLSNKDSFSIMLMGDPQRYSKDTLMQPIFTMEIEWIAKSIEQMNIKAALCAGDLVENNNCLKISRYYKYANQNSWQQWKFISEVFGRLDEKLPYICCTGNHDYGKVCAESRDSEFPKIFTPKRNSFVQRTLVEMCPNAFGIPTLENACYELDTGSQWGKLVVFSIEFGPRDEVLQWVHKTASEKFADKTVILLLHDYINMDAKFSGRPRFSHVKMNLENQPEVYGGNDVWEKLVKRTPNIRLTLCGHSARKDFRVEKNTNWRVDKNDAGKDTYAMVIATHGMEGHGHGSDGWLRILEFLPDGKTLKASTFSPYLYMSPLTRDLSRCKTDRAEFEISIS